MGQYISLDSIMGSISAYDELFKQFGYTYSGWGDRAWSRKMVSEDGAEIEYRGSDWYYSGPRGMHDGNNAKELKLFLLAELNKDQLIALLTA
jgi:hypothetical protein